MDTGITSIRRGPLSRRSLLWGGACGLLSACAGWPEAQGPQRKEVVLAVTAGMELLRFNGGQPGVILERRPIVGLAAGDALVGIDYRVARGVLFALSRSGRLYTLDPAGARLAPVGSAPIGVPLGDGPVGFDFNPVADRIRVVNAQGLNLRLHPDTGAAVDSNPDVPGLQTDGALSYEPDDPHAGRKPELVAAGYTYNKQDDKLTTNFAIDRATGALVIQGSREGTAPVVSPNTGRLRTVGSLGLSSIVDAALDISDVSNSALAAIRTVAEPRTALFLIDLQTGRAERLGRIGQGDAIVGLAIEP